MTTILLKLAVPYSHTVLIHILRLDKHNVTHLKVR